MLKLLFITLIVIITVLCSQSTDIENTDNIGSSDKSDSNGSIRIHSNTENEIKEIQLKDTSKYENDNLNQEIITLNDELSKSLLDKDLLIIKLYDIEMKYLELNDTYSQLNQQNIEKVNESFQITLDFKNITEKLYDKNIKLNEMIDNYNQISNENKQLQENINLLEKTNLKNNLILQEKNKENQRLILELNKNKENFKKLTTEYDILVNFSYNNKIKINENNEIITNLENNYNLCQNKLKITEDIVKKYDKEIKTNILFLLWNNLKKFICKFKKSQSCEIQLLNG